MNRIGVFSAILLFQEFLKNILVQSLDIDSTPGEILE
jgi:hypothetical protein